MLAGIMEVSVRRGSTVVIVMSRGVAITWTGRPRPKMFGLITLPFASTISYELLRRAKTLEFKVLVRSVRTSHACNFQDMWK